MKVHVIGGGEGQYISVKGSEGVSSLSGRKYFVYSTMNDARMSLARQYGSCKFRITDAEEERGWRGRDRNMLPEEEEEECRDRHLRDSKEYGGGP